MNHRTVAAVCLLSCLCVTLRAANLRGVYLETRTCQVYTGPCFANAEVGLAGKDAIMAWNIEAGDRDGVDLQGLSVVMVIRSDNTLGFRGIEGARGLKSVILVDDKANAKQREALIDFAKASAGKAGQVVARVDAVPINMTLDKVDLRGKLKAGRAVELETRKARPGDCICSNESAYYPPLAKLETFAPGVTLKGVFAGKGLGARWSTPDARSSYMATFAE